MIDITSTVKHQITCTDNGVEFDPDTVTLTVLEPDGTSTTVTYGVTSYPPGSITKSATGVYTGKWLCDQAGRHVFTWTIVKTGVATRTLAWEFETRDPATV